MSEENRGAQPLIDEKDGEHSEQSLGGNDGGRNVPQQLGQEPSSAQEEEGQNRTLDEGEEEHGLESDDDALYDDLDYAPDFIMKLVENPPLWDIESKEDFAKVFESYESHYPSGRPKTDFEYIMVYHASLLSWELLRDDRMAAAILSFQLRPAAERVYRKTYEDFVGDGDPNSGRSTSRKWARHYFSDPEYRKAFAKKLETTGYGRGAIESEAFLMALPSLSVIERLRAGREKRLHNIMQRLDACYRARDPAKQLPRSYAALRYELDRSRPAVGAQEGRQRCDVGPSGRDQEGE